MMGFSRPRITQLVKQGMPTEPNGRIRPEIAQQWLDRRRRRPMPLPSTEARERLDHRRQIDQRKAQLLGLEVAERTGALVDRKQAESALFAWVRAERDSWQAFGARLGPVLAARFGLDPAQLVMAVDQAVQEHLVRLAEEPGVALGAAPMVDSDDV